MNNLQKEDGALLTIGELAQKLDVPTHVLRFWEQKLAIIQPHKKRGNRRYYSHDTGEIIAAIKIMLYDHGLTIKGVQHLIKYKSVPEIIALSRQQTLVDNAHPTHDNNHKSLQTYRHKTLMLIQNIEDVLRHA